mmetsp:Transcript_38289/g.36643  ORF Transcript_38289/g.36643 Transcript_38289/m.36643 type:complete len:188 (+) Transcript_38289:632-1195(+)
MTMLEKNVNRTVKQFIIRSMFEKIIRKQQNKTVGESMKIQAETFSKIKKTNPEFGQVQNTIMLKMLEFKRVFNLCKKLFMYEYKDDDLEYQLMMEKYIDEYFKKKLKECNQFASYEQRLGHITDLVDYYNKICNENSRNKTFQAIAEICREKLNQKRASMGIKNMIYQRKNQMNRTRFIRQLIENVK